MGELGSRQRRFADEYLLDLNATAAYKRAGYRGRGRSAENAASRLLGNVGVQQHIAERRAALQEKLELSQERVLKETARLAFDDIRRLFNADGSAKKVSELDDDMAAAVLRFDTSEVTDGDRKVVTHRLRMADKNAALDKLMRHLGLYRDAVDVNVRGDLAERLVKARERVKQLRDERAAQASQK